MGRRWTEGVRSVGLFYQVHPDHRAFNAPEGRSTYQGRTLVFLGRGDQAVVLETAGLDDGETASLAQEVAANLE